VRALHESQFYPHFSGAMAATMAALVVLLAVLGAEPAQGQRLSTGASDWYMRFHDFDTVKRAADRPLTLAFRATAAVRHRYAQTTVETTVHNPSQLEQTFRFGFALPRAAFVSGVSVSSDASGQVVRYVNVFLVYAG